MHYLERGLLIGADVTLMLLDNIAWMLWNTALALLPLLLAAWLFRRPEPGYARRVRWWLGVVAFLAFLPNAPYVLTDLVHLSEDVPAATTAWRMAYVTVPTYLAFCAVGFGAYVVSLIWLTRLLHARGWRARGIWMVEVGLHLACAFGIFLGRFIRFNSWDIVSHPGDVFAVSAQSLAQVPSMGFVAMFFVSLCVLYWPAKHIVIATVAYVRSGGHRHAHALADRYM
jgi:uncharacterized membrane protein